MSDACRLMLGDCLDLIRGIDPAAVDAVVSDPPYGINQDSNNTRFPGANQSYRPIQGDDRPFDPTPWLGFSRVALFGANCFSDKLPMGSWLIWCKRHESMFGKFLADAEAIWINRGFGVYLFQHEWHGFLRASEKNAKRVHPHQKPVAVVEWVMERLGVPEGATVLDPYMGSGTTALACMRTGRKFIGIEKDAGYFAAAQSRIKTEVERYALLPAK